MRVVRYGAGSSAAASTSSAPATQPATHSLAQASVGLLHDTVQWLHHGSDTVTVCKCTDNARVSGLVTLGRMVGGECSAPAAAIKSPR